MTGMLVVVLDGRSIGCVEENRQGKLHFHYDESWRAASDALPLSLSMPLAGAEYPHRLISPFLWNLLPDNEQLLERWARQFQVSARNPFSLLAEVGEDCAGAAQFVRPERLEALLAAGVPEIEWLDEAAIEARLRALRGDPSRGRNATDHGQFSLAGAQPKTALIHLDGRWGVPAGRTPTTHILKPPTGEFDGYAENEHFCLALARRLGLPAASSTVQRFGDEVAIVVERYDRVPSPGPARFARVHQEDFCQALGLPPTAKYQNDGGPTPRTIVEILREHSSDAAADIDTFIGALAFSWIACGTDAHGKNHAVLHGAGGGLRLAPLYDLASALPYETLDRQRMKLAMAIGGEYRVRDIGIRQWHKLARDLRLPAAQVVDRMRAVAAAIATEVPATREAMQGAGIDHPVIARLSKMLVSRAQLCAELQDTGE